MKATLIDLFTSKKFLAALSAIAIYLAGRFGFALDPAALDRIFAALLVYVGAQGVADVGKSAAIANGQTTLASVAMNLAAGKEQAAAARGSGLAPVAALMLACLLGGSMLTACGGTQTITSTPQRIVDCAKQDVGQVTAIAADLARSVTAYLVAGTPVDWDAIEAQAEAAGPTIGGCALGPLVAARAPSASSSSATRAVANTPPANDAARAWAAFARLKAKAGVATYQTSAGPL